MKSLWFKIVSVMRRGVFLSLLLPFILSMGEPAGSYINTSDLSVRVTDRSGEVHELKGLRCTGGYELSFKKGELRYKVPLEDIKKLEVLSVEEERIKVRVILRNGKSDVLFIDSSIKCYSLSSMGEVDFYISDIKTLEIEGVGR